MSIISRLLGRSRNSPEQIVVREIDTESDDYKDDPWPVPWEEPGK